MDVDDVKEILQDDVKEDKKEKLNYNVKEEEEEKLKDNVKETREEKLKDGAQDKDEKLKDIVKEDMEEKWKDDLKEDKEEKLKDDVKEEKLRGNVKEKLEEDMKEGKEDKSKDDGKGKLGKDVKGDNEEKLKDIVKVEKELKLEDDVKMDQEKKLGEDVEEEEEKLKELNKSKPNEEKNAETSDKKLCDNDPICVLPDPSMGKETKRKLEDNEDSQEISLVPPDKIALSNQDGSTQDGDAKVFKDQVTPSQDDLQPAASMIKLHDNIIPLDYYPSMITHRVPNLPVFNQSFVSHVKFSNNNNDPPTYLTLFEVRDKLFEVSSIPVQTLTHDTQMATHCSHLSNTIQFTTTLESRYEPINPLLDNQITDHSSFISHTNHPHNQDMIHLGKSFCNHSSVMSSIQSLTSLSSHVITDNGQIASNSVSVPSHQVHKSADPFSWPSTSSVAHYVQMGETLGKNPTSSTLLSHYVAENHGSQGFHSFVTHQGSCKPRQEHSFMGHMAVNKNREQEDCTSSIAHKTICSISKSHQEPVIGNHQIKEGNLMSLISHRIDISYEKPQSISPSFQTHLINNNYLNKEEHSSIVHQSPSASMTVLCDSPQLTEETVLNYNISSHVAHQSQLQPQPFTGSLISHQVSSPSAPVSEEGCIKIEGPEIINKSEVESKSEEPHTTVIRSMGDYTETNSSKKIVNEPIYAELQHVETDIRSSFTERRKEDDPIYATIIKSKKHTKGAEQIFPKDSQLSLEGIEQKRLGNNFESKDKDIMDDEKCNETIASKSFDSKDVKSRKSEKEVEIGDRDVSAVNKDNYVRENEKKDLESSEILVPSHGPKNEDNRITTKETSNNSCESRERNIVRRNSKKAKRSASMKSETKQQNKTLQKSTSSESMKQRFNMYSIKPKEQEEEPKPVATPPSPARGKARPPVLRNFQLSKFSGQSEEQKAKYLPPPRMRKSNTDEASKKPKKPERKKNRRSLVEDSEHSTESPTPSDQKQDTTTFEFKFVGSNTSVQVVGNFNGWIPEDLFMNNNGLWSKHIELSDGIYFFR